MSRMAQLAQSGDDDFDVVVMDGRRWYVCPVPRCGFRTPADAGAWSRDALAYHVELHYLGAICGSCGR